MYRYIYFIWSFSIFEINVPSNEAGNLNCYPYLNIYLGISHIFFCFDKSVQFSSVTQLCPTLRDHMNRSMPGFPAHQKFPEFTQTLVHWVGDAIQPSHPLSSPFPPAPNTYQHQSLFQCVSSSHVVAKYWGFTFSSTPSNETQDWSLLGWTSWIS